MDSSNSFYETPSAFIKGLRVDNGESAGGGTHFCDGPEFGDVGTGYIFLKDTGGVPEGQFFWQCG